VVVPGHLLAIYDGTAAADATLRAAAERADAEERRLTVLAIAVIEAHRPCCHNGRGVWNAAMLDLAHEHLVRAREVLSGVDGARYALRRGTDQVAVAVDAARELGCDELVLPAPEGRRWRRDPWRALR